MPGKYGKPSRVGVQKLSYRFSSALVSFSGVPGGHISTGLAVLPVFNIIYFGFSKASLWMWIHSEGASRDFLKIFTYRLKLVWGGGGQFKKSPCMIIVAFLLW